MRLTYLTGVVCILGALGQAGCRHGCHDFVTGQASVSESSEAPVGLTRREWRQRRLKGFAPAVQAKDEVAVQNADQGTAGVAVEELKSSTAPLVEVPAIPRPQSVPDIVPKAIAPRPSVPMDAFQGVPVAPPPLTQPPLTQPQLPFPDVVPELLTPPKTIRPMTHREGRQAPVASTAATPPASAPASAALPAVTPPASKNTSPVVLSSAKVDDKRVLVGQVQEWRKTLRLRYAGVDSVDPYGGCVTLSGKLQDIRDGQRVRVTGQLLPPDDRNPQARFVVERAEILE